MQLPIVVAFLALIALSSAQNAWPTTAPKPAPVATPVAAPKAAPVATPVAAPKAAPTAIPTAVPTAAPWSWMGPPPTTTAPTATPTAPAASTAFVTFDGNRNTGCTPEDFRFITKFYNGFVQCSNFPYGNGFDLLYSTLADDFYWYSENNYTIPDATDFVGYNCNPFTLVVNSLWIQNTVCATESDGKRTIVAFWWYNIDLISNPYNLTSAYKDSNNRTHVDVYTNPADFTPINPPININVWNTDIHYVTWDKYQEAYVDHYLISELDSVILYQSWNLAAIPNDE